MKKVFMTMALVLGMSFGAANTVSAENEKGDIVKTYILLSDGSMVVCDGDLTAEQIAAIYDALDN